MDTLQIKPAADLVVRDPITSKALPQDGDTVPASPYWLRRLADGDVELVRPEGDATLTSKAVETVPGATPKSTARKGVR